MKEASKLIEESRHGCQSSTDELMVLLRDQLHEIAQRHLQQEYAGHSLQPTALINEAYLKLVGQTQTDWKNSGHFRAIASNLMRRILVDHARAKSAGKRGGGFQRVGLTMVGATDEENPLELLSVDDLLEQLNRLGPRQAQVAEYRIFGGLTLAEIADALDVSHATTKKDWRFAKAWLLSQMES